MAVPQTRTSTTGRNAEILVSVAVVVFAETPDLEARLAALQSRLTRSYEFFEVLVVDNGTSSTCHGRLAEMPAHYTGMRLLRLSRQYSREVALAAALDHCIGDYVAVMDINGDPIDLLPAMIARAVSGFDAVVAENERRPKTMLSAAVLVPTYRVLSRILGFSIRPDESYFRVFSRRLVNSLIRIRSKNRYLSSLNGIVGFRQCTIVFEQESLLSRGGIRRLLRELGHASGILVSNSAAPLRFAALLGLVASLGNVVYLFYILAVSLIKRRVAEGWITSSLSTTVMFLFLFIILSILAEYVARILDETKEQPLYFVEFETQSQAANEYRERLNIV